MKRRTLLRASAAGLAVVAWPGWLRRAFADEGEPTEKDDPVKSARSAALFDAYRRARRLGRPLLVFVVPGQELIWDRGHAIGELLNHGSDEALAPLALVEVACASAAELALLVPSADAADEVFAVLIETARVPAKTDSVRIPLPSWDVADWSRRDAADAVIDRRIAKVAAGLRKLVVPDAAAAEARVRQAAGHLDVDRSRSIVADLQSGRAVEPAEVDRYAAPIAVAAAHVEMGASRARLIAALAAAVRARLTHGEVTGARWAQGGGCGLEIEGEDTNVAIGCGMGFVPAKSQRFLYLMAELPGYLRH